MLLLPIAPSDNEVPSVLTLIPAAPPPTVIDELSGPVIGVVPVKYCPAPPPPPPRLPDPPAPPPATTTYSTVADDQFGSVAKVPELVKA
jgi:hypothetical protein